MNELARRIGDASARIPIVALLGAEFVSFDAQAMRVTMHYEGRPEFSNGNSIQGGMVSAMLDNAMAVAFHHATDGKFYVPTLEMKTSFLRPAPFGRLIGEGWVVQKGRSIAFLEAQLFDPDRKLLATASSTIKPTPREPD